MTSLAISGLGGSDLPHVGEWRWESNGDLVDMRFWSPDDGGRGRHHLVMVSGGYTAQTVNRRSISYYDKPFACVKEIDWL